MKNLIFMCLAAGMLSGGIYGDAFAVNSTEQQAQNVKARGTLGKEQVENLVKAMKSRYSTTLEIPVGYDSIGFNAFDGVTEVASVIIPHSVKAIDSYAFQGCTGLREVYIPDSVTGIGFSAFEGCTGLREVYIPDSVTDIGFSAFKGCTGLTKIRIPGRLHIYYEHSSIITS